jgi:hypothetical protein
MLKYKSETKRITSMFFQYRNEIDIYTEDEEKDREFYTVLFSRLLDNNIKINDITPLGSKKKVLTHCSNETNFSRKKLYIVDGDIAIINDYKPVAKNLYVLDRYCIENFLIDKHSVAKYIYLNCGTKTLKQIEDEIDFENWLNDYSESLIELFLHFAVSNHLKINFKLCNSRKFHSIYQNSTIFNKSLVKNEINQIKCDIIEKYGEEKFIHCYNLVSNRWERTVNNLLTIVSGKDYLIPILLFKLQCFKKSNSLPSLEEIKINLVQHFDISNLQGLKRALESL